VSFFFLSRFVPENFSNLSAFWFVGFFLFNQEPPIFHMNHPLRQMGAFFSFLKEDFLLTSSFSVASSGRLDPIDAERVLTFVSRDLLRLDSLLPPPSLDHTPFVCVTESLEHRLIMTFPWWDGWVIDFFLPFLLLFFFRPKGCAQEQDGVPLSTEPFRFETLGIAGLMFSFP